MNTCPECHRYLGSAGHRDGCSKRGLSPVASDPWLACSAGMLKAAMQEAMRRKMFSRWDVAHNVAANWSNMKACVDAALQHANARGQAPSEAE